MLAAYATHASSSPLPPPFLSLLLLFLPGTPLRALAIAMAWWPVCYTTADHSIAKGLIDGEHIALAS